jgi:hypothetical protein
MKYEEDPNPKKAKRMSMGIVLKRRDNAPIVKDVYGGALDLLLSGATVKEAQAFVRNILLDVLNNRVPLEKFILSKALRDDYKNPEQIAHRVLADRMAERYPGTAPNVGDRVHYVYVAENGGQSKQGDRIEHVDYVRANKLHYDAPFYVSNQIQNPVAQLFALCVHQLDGYRSPSVSYESVYTKYRTAIATKHAPVNIIFSHSIFCAHRMLYISWWRFQTLYKFKRIFVYFKYFVECFYFINLKSYNVNTTYNRRIVDKDQILQYLVYFYSKQFGKRFSQKYSGTVYNTK